MEGAEQKTITVAVVERVDIKPILLLLSRLKLIQLLLEQVGQGRRVAQVGLVSKVLTQQLSV